MSNETLDEAGVEKKFGVQPERFLDYLTLIGDAIDNIPGVDKVGPKTACKWLAAVRLARGASSRTRTRSAASSARTCARSLDWLPQGARAAHDQARRAAAAEVRRARSASRRTRRSCAQLFERFEIQDVAARARRQARRAPASAAAGGAASQPSALTRARRKRATTETIAHRGAAERVAAAARRRASSRRSTPRRTGIDPMRAQLVGISFSRRARVRGLHAGRLIATPARRSSSPLALGARAAEALARGPGAPQGRPERQVRHARARELRHRASPACSTTRCCSPTCSKATSATTWTTSPSAICG